MAGSSSRLEKISDQLMRELAQLIRDEVRDPRVGMVSVTDVRVTRDLAYATVYVTVMGKSGAEEAAESINALNKASGFLRSLLAKNVNLRTTPKLTFVYDDSINRGSYLSGLIDQALEEDSKHPGED